MTFVTLLLISLILVIHLLFSFITPIILATVIVSLFSPMHQRIMRMVNQREYLAAAISALIVVMLVITPVILFLVALLQQAITLIRSLQNIATTGGLFEWMGPVKASLEWFRRLTNSIGYELSPERILQLAASLSESTGSMIYGLIGNIATNLLELMFMAFLVVALVFVFFISGRDAKGFIMDLVPIPHNEKQRLVVRFQDLSKAVFIGNGLISAMEGLLGGLLFFLFGISGALIWGVAIAITAFLPVVGATIVVVPASIYLFFVQNTLSAVMFLILNSIYLVVLEAFIKPKLIGTKSQMHAALVFLSVLAGLKIYGWLGLFYGPLLVTIFLSLAEIYKEHYRNSLLKG